MHSINVKGFNDGLYIKKFCYSPFSIIDTGVHHVVGSAFLQHNFISIFPFFPPLLPIILSYVYKIFGIKFFVGKVFLIGCNLSSVFLLYNLSRKLFPFSVAFLASFMFSVSFAMMISSAALNSEPLLILLVLESFHFLIEFRTLSMIRLAFLGVLIGLCAMTRMDIAGFYFLLACIFLISQPRIQNFWKIFIVCFFTILVIIPWSISNFCYMRLFNESVRGNDKFNWASCWLNFNE